MNRPALSLFLIVFLTLVGLSSAPAMAAKDKLKVGDDAPSAYLSGIEWIKEMNGEAGGMDNKPMVVEFWATWCGPCIRGIPHLTKIQQKYGTDQMSVIGVTQPTRLRTNPMSSVSSNVRAPG